jgi:curved DNA-binding protein CbpA
VNFSRDPKGYYIVLGIPEDADEAAIKSAFRSRAKRLHPDFNPSPVAARQFHRLHEAYATLCDPRKRAAYDRPWKQAQARGPERGADRADTQRSAGSAYQRAYKPDEAFRATAESARPAPEPPPQADPLAPAVCRCGQVTAQPRFVVFDMVWGRLRRVHRRSLSGIYCRTCADRTAIRASMVTWLAGWWAWPDGPRETVRALVNNFRGGRKPIDRNTRLLLRQARAFQRRNDLDLARSAAQQARYFARTPELKREVEDLITALGPPARILKDRWARPGAAPMIQALPLALAAGLVAGAVTISLSHDTAPVKKPMEQVMPSPIPPPPVADPATSRQIYQVVVEKAWVRTGPARSFQVQTTLKKGQTVIALEMDPRGEWLRAILPDSTTGFIHFSEVKPAPRNAAPEAATATAPQD